MRSVLQNIIWKFGERISAQLVSLVVSIVLARKLMPDDYGVITIVLVFISIANVLVSSGFSSALIQKKNADDTDYSSVFFFSLAISIVLYITLFFVAPHIAVWYKMPILSPTLRVLGLRIIVASVNSVQHAYVSQKMIFRKFFFSTIGGTCVSAIVGIAMAYSDCGVWALVAQYMLNTLIDTVVLFFTVDWRPKWLFSFVRLRQLLAYGWKILVSALVGAIYDNLRSMIIGKRYDNADLAYYSKGQQFPQLIMNNVNSSITAVLFPALASIQDDMQQMYWASRSATQLTTAVIAPMMLYMVSVGESLIRLLLTEKWLPAVPFLSICCIYYLLSAIYISYLQSYKALGRSDIALIVETVDAVSGILLLFLVASMGTYAIAISAIVSRLIAFVICAIMSKQLLGIQIKHQIVDVFAPVILACGMYVILQHVGCSRYGDLVSIVVDGIIGFSIYFAVSFALRLPLAKAILKFFSQKQRVKG